MRPLENTEVDLLADTLRLHPLLQQTEIIEECERDSNDEPPQYVGYLFRQITRGTDDLFDANGKWDRTLPNRAVRQFTRAMTKSGLSLSKFNIQNTGTSRTFEHTPTRCYEASLDSSAGS